MDFGFLRIPWFGVNPKRDSDSTLASTSSLVDGVNPRRDSDSTLASTSSLVDGVNIKRDSELTLASTSSLLEYHKQKASFEIRLWGWTLVTVPPRAVDGSNKIGAPTTINKGLRRRAQQRGVIEPNGGTTIRFRPYVCKVPWHTGARAFLSQLFPRYGHYCGPNWSSGKEGGSLIWDRRPIDWLDFCCYCHDMGYDTHDQEKLLKADLAFLECLERPHMSTKGDPLAHLYKTMCTAGLKNILIPYRRHLVKLQYGQPLIDFGWLSTVRRRNWIFQKT
ncbi:hypothetical protein CCACVL1_07106 [Corchorus capsularis]|uniref:Phospholipase A2 domain-containing protein n=1 Tax=Corchorus capsularis TaxID=210143 RepID=A0A1R3J9F9_COCAP|nr:hypothetical protein CCACVL1_07106 [Corchorus capsularis]